MTMASKGAFPNRLRPTPSLPSKTNPPELIHFCPKENPKAVVEANAEIKTTVEKGEVVAKETAKNAEAASKANPFYVQIGVFSDIANVKKLQIMLDGIGYKSVTEKMQTETGEKMRLRTSTFEGRNEAAIALENIKDAGLTGMVVSQK